MKESETMQDVILYHGSRGGIEGGIKPVSRERCDFGKGFYLGENSMQVKGLVAGDAAPVFYEVKLKLSEIPENRILRLEGMDWIYTVLANRKKCEEFNKLDVAKKWRKKMNSYDVIVGPIADDRMNMAIQRFSEYVLTDKGLEQCLKSVEYGMQYVLKTEYACSKVEILSSHDLNDKEIDEADVYSRNMRIKCKDIVRDVSILYRNDGEYLDQIVKKELQRQKERDEFIR